MTTTTSPPPSQQTVPSPNLTVLHPLVTDTPVRLSGRQRSSSYTKDRLSTFSNLSVASQNRSRPGSHVFPIFHSSLPYALVRDFAYPPIHPFHYGPLPLSASGLSSPVSDQRRLSDPPGSWDSSRGHWSTGPWGTDHGHGHQQLPAMSFGDGPPYSEDEDLHSPVFSAPRHRKNKSTGTDLNGGEDRFSGGNTYKPNMSHLPDNERGMLVSMNADGSETYYVNDEDAAENGPGGDLVTYPANESRYTYIGAYHDIQGYGRDAGFESEEDYAGTHRYSREFQFSVGCPDEEMHGKAVALFDFTREHENELPLAEGQVIFVSYRHGQGWLVAEDPRTGESGLVPEEFVRLVRDIEGGLTSLNGEPGADSEEDDCISPESAGSQQEMTPTTHSTTNGALPVSTVKTPESPGKETTTDPPEVEHVSDKKQ
ncbi:adaptor protein NBP2 [Aspergillus lucknowensis]|uniref:SH3 domain-containing protein n=1 Tax=Aspergillus lucknowensis TaxID=176173 RepID=A0ABR4LI13_9EURO